MNYWPSKIIFAAIASIAMINVNSTYAEDRFSVAIGSKDQLVIFAPNGEKAAELNPPAIAQTVTAGAASFQVSYGRDINDLWTVIVAPARTNPTALSFSALDNKIDSDKNGVVTLTFSKDLKKVTVDPGYVGVVKVNDTRVTSALAVSNSPAPKVAPVTTVAPRKEEVASAPTPTAPAPETASAPKVDTVAPATASASTQPEAIPQLDVKHAYWAEPVTPPDPKDLPVVATDAIKLVEVQGTVTVILPNTTQEVPATNGMTIPTGSTIKTGPDGSAAAFLGGVNSARLMPQSEGTVNQSVANNKRDTLIDMKNGVVFANVGRRPGETQDFKVKTPAGVAAAKGTAFVVSAQGNQLFIATLNGQVLATDANGNFIANSSPSAPGTPGYVNTDPSQNNNVILGLILVKVNAFNQKIKALMAKDPATLTPAEKAYLDSAPKLAEKVAEEINAALLKMEGAGRDPNGGGPGNPGGGGGDFLPPPQNINGNSPINFNPASDVQRTTPT